MEKIILQKSQRLFQESMLLLTYPCAPSNILVKMHTGFPEERLKQADKRTRRGKSIPTASNTFLKSEL
jgi:hypothetical protein